MGCSALESHLTSLLYSFHPGTIVIPRAPSPPWHFTLPSVPKPVSLWPAWGQLAQPPPPTPGTLLPLQLLIKCMALVKSLVIAPMLTEATVFWYAKMLLWNSTKNRHGADNSLVLWTILIQVKLQFFLAGQHSKENTLACSFLWWWGFISNGKVQDCIFRPTFLPCKCAQGLFELIT